MVILSFTTSTKVVIHNQGSTIADGDIGMVKVKAAKRVADPSTANVLAALQAAPPAAVVLQVIDQRTPTS